MVLMRAVNEESSSPIVDRVARNSRWWKRVGSRSLRWSFRGSGGRWRVNEALTGDGVPSFYVFQALGRLVRF